MQKIIFLILLGGVVFLPALRADSDVSVQDQGVKKVGVSWNMAEDRQIENDGGLYQPEGLDKYMKRYFDQFNLKLDQMAQQIDSLAKKVDAMAPQGRGSAPATFPAGTGGPSSGGTLISSSGGTLISSSEPKNS